MTGFIYHCCLFSILMYLRAYEKIHLKNRKHEMQLNMKIEQTCHMQSYLTEYLKVKKINNVKSGINIIKAFHFSSSIKLIDPEQVLKYMCAAKVLKA